MSRNPHKTHCQVPGCRAWAMRGHTHCRPHRDAELGPRGAGAPSGNLNALRSGHHTHALSPDDLGLLAQSILHDPDQLPYHLDHIIQTLHRRCHDPIKTLLALQSLVPALLSRVADELFVAELHTFCGQLPPTRQGQFELSIWHYAFHLSPIHKLDLLRKLQDRIQPPVGVPSSTSGVEVSAGGNDHRQCAGVETSAGGREQNQTKASTPELLSDKPPGSPQAPIVIIESGEIDNGKTIIGLSHS